VIPRKVTLSEHINQPYVYLNCGHVQGNNIFKWSLYSLSLSLSLSLYIYIYIINFLYPST